MPPSAPLHPTPSVRLPSRMMGISLALIVRHDPHDPGSLSDNSVTVRESMDEHFPEYTQKIVDIFAAGDRACCRWVMRWNGPDGGEAILRDAAVITVRYKKIAEKLTSGT